MTNNAGELFQEGYNCAQAVVCAHCEKLGIDKQTAILLEHMCLSHHGEPEFGAAVKPMFLEAELLSELDLMDARLYEMHSAVEAVDECVEAVVETAVANGYEVVMIADHGNADNALNADGTPNTAHSLNPVPFVYVSKNHKEATLENGILADVAPSLCHILGIEQPAEMTGHNLIH